MGLHGNLYSFYGTVNHFDALNTQKQSKPEHLMPIKTIKFILEN